MTNQRIVVVKPGGADALRLIDEPVPTPAANQVRVRVLACGVAFGDVLLRQGGIPGVSFPVTPGYDIMGTVEAIGSAVTRFRAGDRVVGFPMMGGYTTFICLPESDLVAVPANLTPADAVSVVLNYTTAFQLLTKVIHLQRGQRVLMHGAAGGVGTAVLQVAKHLGLLVYGTVSTAKRSFVAQQGGIPIDYTKTDFVQEIRRLTGAGVDVVLDSIGGTNLPRSYEALNPHGTLVFFGASSSVTGAGNTRLNLAGTLARLALLKLQPDRKHVTTYFINPKKYDLFADVATMIEWLNAGHVQPVVAKTFPLSEVSQAHVLLEQNRPIGKLVLLP